MKKNKLLFSALTAALLSSAAIQPVSAAATGSLTGEIGVQVIIGSACTVGNGDGSTGTNKWGTLDFGTYADLKYTIDGSVTGADGSGAVTVTCSTGLSPTLTLDGGLYGDGTVRSVSSDSGTTRVPYRLYSDSARTNEIDVGDTISLAATGTAQNIPIYGRILPSDQGANTSPAAGTYVDTVIATLAW